MIKLINFLLYSNIYIALCAVAMTAQTLYVFKITIKTSTALVGLVFFSTLVIYALHRLVSLSKVDKSLEVERFNVIGDYKRHIRSYAILGMVGGAICFLFLNQTTQYALVIPAVLSLGYVIPFMGSQKLRLRDLHFVKIFLIAIVWAYVTVLLPILEHNIPIETRTIGMLVERMLFIFAITLPFDLRDWEIDKKNNVRTLPATIGVRNTLYLATIILVFWMLLIGQIYPQNIAFALCFSGLSTGIFIYYSPQQKHDYYFTALMDGTMIAQYLLVLLFTC
ncbi:UbiA family prenyltransferase [Aureispira anguillae]|uniref:UbiA family prenyltransferase n=1 Tax=Aureispira anguillae TaxID=2864201 RepID=A0A915YF38_9BACT|nr:UbiA family prenyltransferase [Aureispira anguillae]BDS11880.1 UbiA family prenyltransferase [Aureispira anguillae]